MPRGARKKSDTSVYHAMLRGINQQRIFEEDEDCTMFLKVLGECKKVSGFELFAYCLMGNHVHLLIKVQNEDLNTIFKRIGARYVYWFNWKYRRSGHLFQDRFKSEPVINDKQLLTVLRYIHRNPIKANLCGTVGAYRWSSYNEYIGKTGVADTGVADTGFVLSMTGKEEFVRYNNDGKDDNFDNSVLEDSVKYYRHSDIEAKKMMQEICNCDTVSGFQELDQQKKLYGIAMLRTCGLSIRQISRLTGVSKSIIERAQRASEEA